MRLGEAEILALHRRLIATPSISGSESAIADLLERFLHQHDVVVERLGNTLLALTGSGPLLLFDTHLDTVPVGEGWSRDPFAAGVEDGRVYGLGANDAKAAVAAMIAASLALAAEPPPATVALALVEQEETRGAGTEKVLAELARRELKISGAVFGEPTALDVAVAQKGLLVLELVTRGASGHAAHTANLPGESAILKLARDLVALSTVDLGAPHPELGPATLSPTVLAAGAARNVVPGEARAVLDLRTTPATSQPELIERLQAAVSGEIEVLSSRLAPRATPPGAAILSAALEACPQARTYASPTLSDWALLADAPAVKLGPGASARSHRPDEFVLESEILDGARAYERLAREFARAAATEELTRAGTTDERVAEARDQPSAAGTSSAGESGS